MQIYDIYFFDLDGTLAKSKQAVDSDMQESLVKLATQYNVAIITGGTYEQIKKQVIEFLPEKVWSNMYLLPTSGSVMYEYKKDEWREVYKHALTEEDVEKISRAFAHAIEESGIELPVKTHGEQIENRGSQITFSALGQEAPYEEKKKWDPDHKKREKITNILKEHLPEFEIGIGGTTSIDIVKKGVDKAHGIRKITDYLNTTPEKCIYIGDALFDGGNDSVVFETNIHTEATSGPQKTVDIIDTFLRQ